MTSEQLKEVTKPFMQTDVSTTKIYGGTGLGMNLTEHLANLLGIELTVDSTPNKGTHFNLLIPLVYKNIYFF